MDEEDFNDCDSDMEEEEFSDCDMEEEDEENRIEPRQKRIRT